MANDIAFRQITSGIYLHDNTMLEEGYLQALGQTEASPYEELMEDDPIGEDMPEWTAGNYTMTNRAIQRIASWKMKYPDLVLFTSPPIQGHPAPGMIYKTERSDTPNKINIIRFYQNGIKTFGLDEELVSMLMMDGELVKYSVPATPTPLLPVPITTTPVITQPIVTKPKLSPAVALGIGAIALYLLTRMK